MSLDQVDYSPSISCENSMKSCLQYCIIAADYYGPAAQKIAEEFTPVGPTIKKLKPVGKLLYKGSQVAADKF